MNTDEINLELYVNHTQAIIEKAFETSVHNTLASTSLKDYSLVFLDILSRSYEGADVVFVDTGYLTEETLILANRARGEFGINLHIYRPLNPLNIPLDQVPTGGEELTKFSQRVKVEPFERALKEFHAKVLITGAQNNKPGRDSLDTVRKRQDGILEFRAMAHWNPRVLQMYAQQHDIPINTNYVDVCTGPDGQKECGLFTQGGGI